MNTRFVECEKKATPEIKKLNDRLKEDYCMNQDGFVYIFYGDTYAVKDELKAIGARFNYLLGWHMNTKPDTDKYPFVEVHISDICYMDPDTGEYWEGDPFGRGDKTEIRPVDFIKEIIAEAEGVTGNTVGTVGERLSLELKLVAERHWEEPGYHYWDSSVLKFAYTFVDSDGNTFVWFTTSGLVDNLGAEDCIGQSFNVRGTIKAHDVYKGVRRTVLTRCRVTPIGD